jgi:hypothetical protein
MIEGLRVWLIALGHWQLEEWCRKNVRAVPADQSEDMRHEAMDMAEERGRHPERAWVVEP